MIKKLIEFLLPGMSVERKVGSVAEMQALAKEIAARLTGGEVILLEGELGVGKTTFTQGLAGALGVVDTITSPTFTLVSDYAVTSHPRVTLLVHVDLYRLEPNQAQRDPMVAEVLARGTEASRVTVIEWADRLEHPPQGQHISFRHGQHSQERIVTVS